MNDIDDDTKYSIAKFEDEINRLIDYKPAMREYVKSDEYQYFIKFHHPLLLHHQYQNQLHHLLLHHQKEIMIREVLILPIYRIVKLMQIVNLMNILYMSAVDIIRIDNSLKICVSEMMTVKLKIL